MLLCGEEYLRVMELFPVNQRGEAGLRNISLAANSCRLGKSIKESIKVLKNNKKIEKQIKFRQNNPKSIRDSERFWSAWILLTAKWISELAGG
jgi:hypothetical protein